MIHPHSKNIGIHAYSRNASLVRALMSVSRQLRARSLSMEKRRRFSARKKTSISRNFGRKARALKRDSRWTAPDIYSYFTKISGKFHCICRTRRLPKRFNDRLRPISESKHPRYIYIYIFISRLMHSPRRDLLFRLLIMDPVTFSRLPFFLSFFPLSFFPRKILHI